MRNAVGQSVAALLAAVTGVIGAGAAAGSSTINLPLSAVGQASSPDGNTFTVAAPTGDQVSTVYHSSNAEKRAVLEFSLAGLPAGATLESVNLQFNVAAFDSNTFTTPPLYPFVQFYGYAGDNATDNSDATRDAGGLPLAQVHINDAGAWDVPLDVDNIQSLFDGHAAAIGVLTYAQSVDLNVDMWSAAQGTSAAAPTIVLTYSGGTATLAGDFNGDGRIDAADLAVLDNGFGHHLTGYANGDFNGDGVIDFDDFALFDRALAQYVPTGSPAAVGVPEPGTVVAGAGMLLAGLLPRRRRNR
jgi:hypothetical protein